MKLTRTKRRQMRRNADRIAAVLAAGALESDGGMRAVTDPTARRVLREGYAEMIRNGCKPITNRITHKQAASLPGCRPTPPGAQWWIALGLDCDGRGTWTARWAYAPGLPPDDVRDLIEVKLLADLARAANVSGLPVEVQQ
jgi:hypothetical protein